MLRLATKLMVTVSAAVAFGVVAAPAVGAEEAAPEGAVATAAAPLAWSYTIQPSCGGWEGPIRQGANYWGDVTEGGGTPVECQNSAITDCGFLAEPVEMLDVDGQLIVVGCNYGSGKLIKLFPGAVNDAAL